MEYVHAGKTPDLWKCTPQAEKVVSLIFDDICISSFQKKGSVSVAPISGVTKQLLIKRDEIRHVVFSLQQSARMRNMAWMHATSTYTCHHHDQPSGIIFVPPCLVTNLEIFQANRAGLHNTLLVSAEVHHYGITRMRLCPLFCLKGFTCNTNRKRQEQMRQGS